MHKGATSTGSAMVRPTAFIQFYTVFSDYFHVLQPNLPEEKVAIDLMDNPDIEVRNSAVCSLHALRYSYNYATKLLL